MKSVWVLLLAVAFLTLPSGASASTGSITGQQISSDGLTVSVLNMEVKATGCGPDEVFGGRTTCGGAAGVAPVVNGDCPRSSMVGLTPLWSTGNSLSASTFESGQRSVSVSAAGAYRVCVYVTQGALGGPFSGQSSTRLVASADTAEPPPPPPTGPSAQCLSARAAVTKARQRLTALRNHHAKRSKIAKAKRRLSLARAKASGACQTI